MILFIFCSLYKLFIKTAHWTSNMPVEALCFIVDIIHVSKHFFHFSLYLHWNFKWLLLFYDSKVWLLLLIEWSQQKRICILGKYYLPFSEYLKHLVLKSSYFQLFLVTPRFSPNYIVKCLSFGLEELMQKHAIGSPYTRLTHSVHRDVRDQALFFFPLHRLLLLRYMF